MSKIATVWVLTVLFGFIAGFHTGEARVGALIILCVLFLFAAQFGYVIGASSR